MDRLKDKVALVIGAGQSPGESIGNGRATAIRFAQEGARVMAADRDEDSARQTVAMMEPHGADHATTSCDVTLTTDIESAEAATLQRWGRLDILVLNAGQLGTLSPLSHTSLKDWERVVGVNLTAPFRFLRAFDGLLRQSDKGRVIGLTTTPATRPRAYWGPYAATKAAMENLLDCYADEVASITPIRVAVVNPGATRTNMRKSAFPGENPETLKTPDVVANALLDLLVQDFETGHRLTVTQKA